MKYLPLSILTVCALALPAFGAKPNIVFIMADDLGWKDVGYHGGKARTPHIDSLASKGRTLERYYAYPMCNPTRVALMTGRNAAMIANDVAKAGGQRGSLPLDERTMPQVFHEAGYQTFMMGKWHLGRHHVDFFPTGRGFDHFYGFLNAGLDYESHIAQGGLDWQRNGASVREKGYTTDLLTSEAVELLKGRDKSKPTFLYLAYNAVHTPLQAPDSAQDAYANIADESKRTFYAMTTRMDDGIGRVLETIKEEGMADDTIVVFVSDNGGTLRNSDNTPLRGGKTSSFEGGIRVPGVIYAPGQIEGGETEQFVTVHDWLPTLAAAADVPLGKTKKLYGKDLWAALRDDKPVDNRNFLLAQRGNFAVFEDGWKLVRNNGEFFLFEIEEDPSEETDVKEQHPELFARLKARVDEVDAGGGQVAGGRGGPGGRGRGGPGGRGRGGRGLFPITQEETREPWAEAASRD